MKRFVILLTAVVMVALAGCNTVRGFGQDVQKAGDAITGASQK